jgi:hypothetical protein
MAYAFHMPTASVTPVPMRQNGLGMQQDAGVQFTTTRDTNGGGAGGPAAARGAGAAGAPRRDFGTQTKKISSTNTTETPMIQRRNAWHSAGLRRDRVPPSTAGAPPPGWEHYLLKGGWVGNLAGRIGCRPKLPKALPTVADLKALMPPSKKRRAGRGLGTGA